MKWLRNCMYGRYGIDQLGNCLFSIYFITLLISIFIPFLRFFSYAIVILFFYRMFSKQYYKRRQENTIYLQNTLTIRKSLNKQRNKFKYRKTHKYFKCPQCHQDLRVPRGKGEITITCPQCHHQFDKRT